MTKQLFLFLLIVFAINTGPLRAQDLNAGGWTTSNSSMFTRITGTNNLNNYVYRIECTTLADNDILKFNVIVDGVTIPVSFYEGTYIAVEGKNIALQQISPGKMIKGSWKIIQQPEVAATTLPWVLSPKLNTEMLIANLKTEQEFLLTINYTSSNCTNTGMTVMIDGQPIKDNNNNVLTFAEGSTIYAKGKTVTLRVTGNCTGNNAVTGELKLRK